MTTNLLLYSLCATLFMALVSWGLQIYVSRQLSKAGQAVPLPIGKRSWIAPFVFGWQYAKQLGLTEVMIAWSIVLVFVLIGAVVTVIALQDMYRSTGWGSIALPALACCRSGR